MCVCVCLSVCFGKIFKGTNKEHVVDKNYFVFYFNSVYADLWCASFLFGNKAIDKMLSVLLCVHDFV